MKKHATHTSVKSVNRPQTVQVLHLPPLCMFGDMSTMQVIRVGCSPPPPPPAQTQSPLSSRHFCFLGYYILATSNVISSRTRLNKWIFLLLDGQSCYICTIINIFNNCDWVNQILLQYFWVAYFAAEIRQVASSWEFSTPTSSLFKNNSTTMQLSFVCCCFTS